MILSIVTLINELEWLSCWVKPSLNVTHNQSSPHDKGRRWVSQEPITKLAWFRYHPPLRSGIKTVSQRCQQQTLLRTPDTPRGLLKPPDAFLSWIKFVFANMIPEESYGSIENRWVFYCVSCSGSQRVVASLSEPCGCRTGMFLALWPCSALTTEAK